MSNLRYLHGVELKIWRPEGATHLRVEIDGDRCVLNARIKRAFPLSGPEDYLSIQDGAGKEVGILKSIVALEPESKALVEEELDRRYFTPKIHRVQSLKMEAGMWHWKVATQRGTTEFYVRNWRDNSHEISPNRWQIHSVDGARFDIEDMEALDERSKRLLEQLI